MALGIDFAVEQPTILGIVSSPAPDADLMIEEPTVAPPAATDTKVTFEYFGLEAMGLVSVGIICELDATPHESVGNDGILFTSHKTSISDVTLERGTDWYTNQEVITVGYGGGRFSVTGVCEDPTALSHRSSSLLPRASHQEITSVVTDFQAPSVVISTLASDMVPALTVSPDHTRRANAQVLKFEPLYGLNWHAHAIVRDENKALAILQPNTLAVPLRDQSESIMLDGAGDALKHDITQITPVEPSEIDDKSSQEHSEASPSSLNRLSIHAVSSKHDQSKALAPWQPRTIVTSAATTDTRHVVMWFNFWETDLGDVIVRIDISVKIIELSSMSGLVVELPNQQNPLVFVSQTVGAGDRNVTRFQVISTRWTLEKDVSA